MAKDKIYDRMAADLPINSVVAPDVVKDQAGDYIRVLRSIKSDQLFRMFSHKQVDEAEFAAGRLWQRYRQESEIGGAQAIDPTREAVDGGRFKEPDITKLSRALAELRKAGIKLGPYNASIIHDVLARHMTITEIAEARSITSGRHICDLMDRFRDSLNDLAKLWGLATR